MFIKRINRDFPKDCVGRVFKCTKTDVNFYKVGAFYKVLTTFLGNVKISCPNDFNNDDGWNGVSAEFVEVVHEEQLSLNFL